MAVCMKLRWRSLAGGSICCTTSTILRGWRYCITAKLMASLLCWTLTSTAASRGAKTALNSMATTRTVTAEANCSETVTQRRPNYERALQSLFWLQERAVFAGNKGRRYDEKLQSYGRKGTLPVCREPGSHRGYHRRCGKRQVLGITLCLGNTASVGISRAVCYGDLRDHHRAV